MQDVYEVMLPLWGAPPSGQLFDQRLTTVMKEEMGAVPVDIARGVWTIRNENSEALIGIQVDDLLISIDADATELEEHIVSTLKKAFKDMKFKQSPGEVCGVKVDVDDDKHLVQLSMPVYIEDCIKKYAPHLVGTVGDTNAVPARTADLLENVKPRDMAKGAKLDKTQKALQCEIGAVQYLAHTVRADILPYAWKLSTVMSAPDHESCRPLLDSIWKYLHAFPNRGPTYGGTDENGKPITGLSVNMVKSDLDMNEGCENFGEYLMAGDADLAQPPQKCKAAGVHMWAKAAISVNLNSINAIMVSSTDAEVHAACSNLMLGSWIREYLAAAGYPEIKPTLTFADNMPTVQLGNGSSPTRSRHIAKRIAYCADKVQKGEFLFKHVKDENNPADFLTKWVNPKKFRASIRYIFNTDAAIVK